MSRAHGANFPRGLLGSGGGAAWSYLTTDGGGGLTTDGGGGGGRATDGGGGTGPRRSLLLSEAIRRSQAALVREADRPPQPSSPGGRAPADVTPLPALLAWDSAVKSDLVQVRLLSGLEFGGAAVAYRTAKGPQRLYVATAPDAPLLLDQAEQVRQRAQFRDDRFPEIATQVEVLWPFWDAILKLELRRAPRTHELLHAGLLFAASVVMQLKHDLAVPRPSDVSPLVMPIIDVPGHASFPSGHAMAAQMLSSMLVRLLELNGIHQALLQRLAWRVAYNREVAGVHYPLDSAAGRVLGESLAAYLHRVATGSGSLQATTFDAAALTVAQGVELAGNAVEDLPLDAMPGVRHAALAELPARDALVGELWTLAVQELRSLGRRP